ncbi:alpha-hydroxy-acid oxidizing protein [Roseomonas ludipueritiae]|uniref:Alpha-hydroxy-acid oxidizing protein n=2 Tax=Pseudoroseomonas ludipueritiae TaxID=198093 RepID=A0ABR7R5W4_9PROT|nr:alpha-hydroxy-acid oxidizing protein [Pseudoroseomonas ludipueritiae]
MPDVKRRDVGAPDVAVGMREAAGARPDLAKPLVRQVPRRMRHILSLDDLEKAARRHLPRPIFGYVSGAAEDNLSRADNRQVFSEYRFITRVLRNVSARSQATDLLGRTYAMPFGIAPMGISALIAYRGDLVLARAARQLGIPMIMSGSSLIRLEEVFEANPDMWFQAYLPGEPDKIAALVDRVAKAGVETLVLTVDTAVLANRENNIRSGFSTPLKPSPRLAWDGLLRLDWTINTFLRTLWRHGMPHFENSYATRGAPIMSGAVMRDFGRKDHLDWGHLGQIRRQWKGRLIVKGILHPEDARLAREAGADGIILSNHGGRQLDGAVSPLRTLPAAVEAARGIPVMMDCGIRRGTDVLKAMALGAAFVFVGRPFVYAAALAGEQGVLHAANLLGAEVMRDLGLLGVSSPSEIAEDLLVRLDASSRNQGVPVSIP